jgi:uncharacterized protein (DUF305 family)
MIHHHESGRKMATAAKEKATDPELKELAAKIDEQQGKEIEKMTKWLKDWHDEAPDDSLVPEETKKMEAATGSALASAKGKDFDRLFAAKMAEHHASGIAMAELATEHAEHAEAKNFAKEMIAMQSQEKETLMRHAK